MVQWYRHYHNIQTGALEGTGGTGGTEGTEGNGFQCNKLGNSPKNGKKTRNLGVKPISQGVYKLKIDLRVGSKPDRTLFDGLAMSFGPSQDTGVLQS